MIEYLSFFIYSFSESVKSHEELAKLFSESTAGFVYVISFPNKSLMCRYLSEIAWETEV